MTIRDAIAAFFSVATLFAAMSGVAAIAAYSPAGSAQMQAESLGFDALAFQVFGNGVAGVEPCAPRLAGTVTARAAE